MTEAPIRWTGLLERADWRRMSIEAATAPELGADQLEARIELLAITANTVTYAVLGDRMHYWKLFPTETGRGIVPAWGTAVVERSRHPDIAPGSRLYGIWPTASHCLMRIGQIDGRHVRESSAHRQPLFPIYNQYDRLGQPNAQDALSCVFRPLLTTAAMLQDALAEKAFGGAEQVLLLSASSKTALLSAFCLGQGQPRPQRVLGLTSAPNLEFVRSLHLYDVAAEYGQLESLNASTPTALLDFAGNGEWVERAHRHFGKALKLSLQIGKSHWSAPSANALPGPRPELFFAPAQIAKRLQDWGAAGFSRHIGDTWRQVLATAAGWTRIRDLSGAAGLSAAWTEMVSGNTPATDSLVVRFPANAG